MNLREEMEQAVSDVGKRHIDAVRATGVSPASIASLGARQPPFGVALIAHGDDGLWWPDDNGVPRLLIPCIERGEYVDIIALKPAEPDVWFHRTGAAAILGADNLATCIKDYPLDVVTNPMGWLALGGDGVCILNWSAPYHELSPLRDWPELRVDSPRLGNIVRRHLMHPHPIPTISLASKDQDRHAA